MILLCNVLLITCSILPTDPLLLLSPPLLYAISDDNICMIVHIFVVVIINDLAFSLSV